MTLACVCLPPDNLKERQEIVNSLIQSASQARSAKPLAALIALSLAMLLSLHASAQSDQTKKAPASPPKKTAKWAQEPTAFIGIAFGKPLAESVPWTCPMERSSTGGRPFIDSDALKRRAGELCIDDSGSKDGYVLVRNVSVPNLNMAVNVFTNDGTSTGLVESTSIMVEKKNFEAALQMLTEKYGPPHRSSKGKLQTTGGAEFENQIREWNGSKVSIRMDSFDYRYIFEGSINDWGHVRVETAAFRERTSKSTKDAAKQGASKL